MEPLSVNEVKSIELEILDEFVRICSEQGITYYLGYGTLLGAARHEGFIPWDDDIDVIMMREDYERLVAGFDWWRSSDRFSLAFYRDGRSVYPFAKIVDANTLVKEDFARKDIATGVWIDVFPLDRVDLSDLRASKRIGRLSLARSFIVADPSVGSSFLAKAAKRIVCPVAHRLDAVKYARLIDESARDACDRDTGYVAALVDDGYPPRPIPDAVFSSVVHLPFEGRSLSVPSGYKELLGLHYGDWKQIPPEDKRAVHVVEAYRLSR